MLRDLTLLSVAVLAGPAIAATTIQQDFDAAQALLDAGKASEARDAFSALLGRFSPSSQGKAISLVRARLGSALIATSDPEEAETVLVAALPGFRGTTPQDKEERGIALYDLGRALEAQGKLDSAAASYRRTMEAGLFPADSSGDLGLRAALARTQIWSNPAEARRLLDGLLAMPPERFGKTGDSYAQLQTLRGRVELNNDNAAEARRWFVMAAKTAGGAETINITVADVRIRGDMALANFKLGKMDEVQKNVAFSGAGSLVSEGLGSAARMTLPDCAPLSGLAPDAVAVVEFAIDADGRVTGVTPVYASRGSGLGGVPGALDDGPEVLFPQAVRSWFWSTENIAKLDPFWRQSVRVELRCFTSRPDSDPVTQSFARDYRSWAEATGLQPLTAIPENDVTALPILRAELARREKAEGPGSPQLIPALYFIANNQAATSGEREAAAARRTALLVAAGAPATVIGEIRIRDIAWTSRNGVTRKDWARYGRDALLPLLAEQEAAGTGDTRIAMYTRLRLAEAHDDLHDTAASRALLDRIIAAPEALLSAGDPIRTAALLRLSSQAVAAKDTATAATAFAATGLTAEQCSLVDVRPQAVNTVVSSNAFPDLTRRWGTGGFARVGYDITADGKTMNMRTITASPPFIFGPATEKAIGRFEFRPVFRPGNSVGCTGNVQSVRFRVAS